MSDPLDHDDDDYAPVAGYTPPPPPWLAALNPQQRAAVESLDGPVLVLAGAGTGKTRVLTTRLAYLLYLRKAKPWQVLAVTFTNKAAREMKTRIADLVGPVVEGMWLGTFHALATRILRRHAELVGLKSDFTILDADDQVRLLKQILDAEHVDEKRWPARLLMGTIQRWKDKGLTPDKLSPDDAGEMANGRLVDIYRQYQERLLTLNAADFGDLLLHCLTLFLNNADVLKQYQSQFRYMLVDEYQDTNIAQYMWLRLLAQGNKNICCVGDEDQSIYGWRGAEIGNILKFEKDFHGAKVIRLERNYRSSANILGAASGLIAKNEGRLGKTLWTEDEAGDPVQVRGVWDSEEEARWIGGEVEALQVKGHSLDEIAILVRAGFQTREFEERMITLGIPYRVVGGPRFYEREEIRDAIAYLRLIRQPADDLAFERIANKPTRGIGKTTEQALHALARMTNRPLYFCAREIIGTDELKPAARRSLTQFVETVERWRDLVPGLPLVELVETVLDESGYTDFWRSSKKPEAPGKVENLKELRTAVEDFENLDAFLEHVSLVMDADQGGDAEMVSIMTLHAAKGLEFETVFLPGWEEGLFPHQRALNETGLAGLEEERRLAYVGITRAKRKCIVTHAANRRMHGSWTSSIPSRFIDELPKKHIEIEGEEGLYAGRRDSWGMQDRMGGGHATGLGAFSDNSAGQRYASEGGGPGWRRLQARGASRPVIIDAKAELVRRDDHGFGEGERVFHQKFGTGTVIGVDGDHLTIDFDHAGQKKLVASFVERA